MLQSCRNKHKTTSIAQALGQDNEVFLACKGFANTINNGHELAYLEEIKNHMEWM